MLVAVAAEELDSDTADEAARACVEARSRSAGSGFSCNDSILYSKEASFWEQSRARQRLLKHSNQLEGIRKRIYTPGFERCGIQLPGSEREEEKRKKDTFIEITEYGLVGGFKDLEHAVSSSSVVSQSQLSYRLDKKRSSTPTSSTGNSSWCGQGYQIPLGSSRLRPGNPACILGRLSRFDFWASGVVDKWPWSRCISMTGGSSK